jgi:hypothetical protein
MSVVLIVAASSDAPPSTASSARFSLSSLHIDPIVVSPIDPRFPLELERMIFENAAFEYPGKIPTFLRVAHRIRTWYLLNFDKRSF